MAFNDPAVMFGGAHAGPGAFFRLMPHNAMVALFGGVFIYAVLALFMGVARLLAGHGERQAPAA